MALKRHFSDEEKYGLAQEEIRLGEKYLRKNKTAGKIPEKEALKLYELFLIGHSFNELASQFPQYPVDRIILTAALSGWCMDRDNMQYTVKDRVQAKVVKSVIEQVDFLTVLLSVSNAEHIDAMRRYIIDPINNPKPDLRIETIKEYKEVVETLSKIIAGSTPGSRSNTAPMFSALGGDRQQPERLLPPTKEDTSMAADFISEQVKKDGD